MNPLAHVLLCLIVGDDRGRRVRWDRGNPEGDRRGARGDLDDHAQLDRDLGRASICSASRARFRTRRRRGMPISNDIVEGAQAAGLLGRRLCRACSRRLHRRRNAGRLLDVVNRTTWGSRCAPSGSTPRPRTTAASRLAEEHPRDGHLGRFAGLAGAVDMPAGTTGSGRPISGAPIGFLGIAAALLGRNTAVGVGFAWPSSSGR